MRTYVAAKLHNLTVTDASVHYVGSVTVDAALLARAGIDAYEAVDVVNLNNGARWTTYVIPGSRGVFTLNGGGARLGVIGDRCVLIAYRQSERFERAAVVFVDESNDIDHATQYP